MPPGAIGAAPSRLRAALGTAVFILLVPGTVVGWIPWALSAGWTFGPPLAGLGLLRWLGAALIAAGLPVFVDFALRFVREGLGTPAPIAPPERLVVGGSFRWCRNPGYVAVLALLVGQALLLGSPALLGWAAAVALAFHLFVLLWEEPDLRRRFGADYEAYCRRVPRWIPRPPRD